MIARLEDKLDSDPADTQTSDQLAKVHELRDLIDENNREIVGLEDQV